MLCRNEHCNGPTQSNAPPEHKQSNFHHQMIKKFLSYAAKGRYAFTNITGQKKCILINQKRSLHLSGFRSRMLSRTLPKTGLIVSTWVYVATKSLRDSPYLLKETMRSFRFLESDPLSKVFIFL